MCWDSSKCHWHWDLYGLLSFSLNIQVTKWHFCVTLHSKMAKKMNQLVPYDESVVWIELAQCREWVTGRECHPLSILSLIASRFQFGLVQVSRRESERRERERWSSKSWKRKKEPIWSWWAWANLRREQMRKRFFSLTLSPLRTSSKGKEARSIQSTTAAAAVVVVVESGWTEQSQLNWAEEKFMSEPSHSLQTEYTCFIDRRPSLTQKTNSRVRPGQMFAPNPYISE